MNWREYQNQAAAFFRQLGLTAEIEFQVEGVRGVHVVDVYATGNFNGIDFTWVVECKAWKSNVPKEKVMVLTSIVQDVGADRGFLLSEVGFQSGAIRAAQNSNITLTSIEELSHSTKEFRVGALEPIPVDPLPAK
ncbi:restriction endonuclease [Methylocaldum sp. BRCS4]|nr:restriction endonuclease [Methylocaldum sp. BRCS4]